MPTTPNPTEPNHPDAEAAQRSFAYQAAPDLYKGTFPSTTWDDHANFDPSMPAWDGPTDDSDAEAYLAHMDISCLKCETTFVSNNKLHNHL